MRISFIRSFLVVSVILNLLVSQLSAFFTAPAYASPSHVSDSSIDALPISDPSGADKDWLTRVEAQIKNEEYSPTLQTQDSRGKELPEPSWHLVNRAHNLRSYLRADSWTLQPRETGESNQWIWESQLESWGRIDGVVEVVSAKDKITSDKQIVSIERKGLTEWYQNSEKGIKQNFTLTQKPEGVGEVVIRSSVKTSLALKSSNTQIAFLDTHGLPRLTLDNLAVIDANKNQIPARFEVDQIVGNYQLDIVIDDTNAIYPLTIDPLATTAAWIAESDQASANFGYSVSTAGDVNGDGYSDVIVGAYLYDNGQTDEGRAYVYYGSASGLPSTASWTSESDQASANFGYSVSTAGDVNGDGYSDVIVGAYLYDNGQTDEGRAYVYYGSASGLPSTASWTSESDQASANFGYSVSTAGDVNGDGYSDVIVGAYLYDNGQTDEGRAYVYLGSASGLATIAAWTTESDQASANFGYSVSTAGDVNGDGYSDVIVGAYLYDNGESDEGAAFVYHGSASGLSATANWTAESNRASSDFGISVSTAGDVNGDGYSDVIVGAYHYANGQADEGAAFVYHGSASGLSATANWTGESNQATAAYGVSVSTAGDVNGDGYSDVIVGAYLYDNGQADEGAAFVYHGSASGLSTSSNWTAESDQASANFGYSVSTAGDVNGDGYSDVIVGAYLYDNGQTDEGRAYVYYGSASTLSTTVAWTAEGNQDTAVLGYSVSTAGDVNGDGYSDVIVGAMLYDSGQVDEGKVFVYHGSASGLSTTANWTAESNQASADFGNSVSTAGDVNGDGYSDVIVGAYLYDNGESDEGAAFVYHGSASGLSTTANWTAESNRASSDFGISVSTAGDVNGDGYSDVIVGAYHYANGQAAEGAAFVYHGSASGLSATANWTVESNLANTEYGRSVSTAGDVNGDGYSDVIVGAYLYDNGESDEGAAFVYHGSASGLSATANWTAESNQGSAQFGYSVSTAGDVNGDGYSDVIVGALYYDDPESAEGAAFVYHGSASGLSATANWTGESNQVSALFGYSVSTAGDVNGDGYSDVIVGSFGYDNGQVDEGAAFVYHGSASGLSNSADWTGEVNQATARFGTSVSTAGDVNGDGYSDVIVGAYLYDNGNSNEGGAFVYYGNNGGGLTTVPRQLNSVSRQIQLGNKSDFNELYLGMLTRTPMGRTRVKLWWELKLFGVNFDMNNLSKNSSWTDSTITPIETLSSKLLLLNSSPYHWRVRLQYYPNMNFTPWFSIGGNGWNEKDVLTSDTPIYPPPPNPGGGGGCTNEAPRAPQLYASEKVDANSIRLFFSDPGGTYDRIAVEYGVERGKYIYGADNIGPKGTRTYIVSGLPTNKTYYFRVRAGNGCMPGVWSSELKSAVLLFPKSVSVATELAKVTLSSPIPSVSISTPSPVVQEEQTPQVQASPKRESPPVTLLLKSIREEILGNSTYRKISEATNIATKTIANVLVAAIVISAIQAIVALSKLAQGLEFLGSNKVIFLGIQSWLLGVVSPFIPLHFFKKKKGLHGQVIDSISSYPVSGVFLVIFSSSGNLKVTTTDSKGGFYGEVPDDIYEFKAVKGGYKFPSDILKSTRSATYSLIYQPGNKIKLGKDILIKLIIPIDPLSGTITRFEKTISYYASKFSFLLSVINVAVSLYCLFIFPNILNGLIFLLFYFFVVRSIMLRIRWI